MAPILQATVLVQEKEWLSQTEASQKVSVLLQLCLEDDLDTIHVMIVAAMLPICIECKHIYDLVTGKQTQTNMCGLNRVHARILSTSNHVNLCTSLRWYWALKRKEFTGGGLCTLGTFAC